MNVHKKIGPFPVWAWGVAITGGIVLGIYLRRRAASSARQATADPNAALDALAGSGSAFGMADPNSGLDSGGIISGLMQQQQDLLSYLLATSGGGGSVPAIGDPATYGPAAVSSPTSTSTLAAPVAAVQPISAPTYDAPTPAPADPQYPYSTLTPSGTIDTGTVATPSGATLTESPGVAAGSQVLSAATSSTGGVGGTGYLQLSDKTLIPSVGVNVMQ